MYSIELRVDVGGADWIPHTSIVVAAPDGQERGYGVAPEKHVSFSQTRGDKN